MTIKRDRQSVVHHFQTRRLPERSITVLLLLMLPAILTVEAMATDLHRYRGGLRNSPGEKKLGSKELDKIIAALREKTGFSELAFDEHGFLSVGDRTRFSGGSALARALVAAAIEINNVIDLESHNYSKTVAFGRLNSPVSYQNRSTGQKIEVYPLEIDFSDFSKLRGDKMALAAFDVGFIILHELGHAVLDLRDAVNDPRSLGECEEYINRIRQELNLPLRQTYIAQTFVSQMVSSQKPVQFAELFFAPPDQDEKNKKNQKLSLSWEATMVGPVKIPINTRRTTTTALIGQ